MTDEINGLYKQLNSAETLEDVEGYLETGTPVLNALNTRYIILNEAYPPLENPYALGPAWFVDSIVIAENPDEEIALLGAVDLRQEAVVTTPLNFPPSLVEDETIDLISYAPNRLVYEYETATDRLAVFSEIAYPDGWHASVDGQPIDLLRADWTFRAALLPAGKHRVEMYFLPDSYRVGAAVSRWTSLALLLILLGSVALSFGKSPAKMEH